MISVLAQNLNTKLEDSVVWSLFSNLGKRMYFPNGIISQGTEASEHAKVANGTIGMAIINGEPAELKSIKCNIPNFKPQEVVAYAKTAGDPALRKLWKEKIIEKNPDLKNKKFSLPIVVPGLTAVLSYVADLFIDENKPLLAPKPCWDNYELIACARRNAEFRQFKCFDGDGLNLESFEEEMRADAEKYGSVRVILNFPQNPSGYSPTHTEAAAIVSIIKKLAEEGTKILVLNDDAYFGLNYEDNIESQSLFAYLADLHENVLAIKADGPTKEDFAWGLRCGFVTFASKGMTDEQYEALQVKFMGVIRSSVSCSSTPAQSLILHLFDDPKLDEEKKEFCAVLKKRYALVKKFLSSHESKILTPLPFNSGYFMSFGVKGVDAEELRKKLLFEKGIGTISINYKTLRVAFSSIDESKIESVYEEIYKTAEELIVNN